MERKGSDFNKVAAAVEQILLGTQQATLGCNVFLDDKTAKSKREFDILITHTIGHHKITTAIECKDWKKKVDAPVVDAFVTKCRDCDINKSVIVCSKGFTKSAIEKATHYGVTCLELTEVKKFDWFAAQPIMIQVQNVLLKQHFNLKSKNTLSSIEGAKAYHKTPEGIKELTPEYLKLLATGTFNTIQAPIADQERNIQIIIQNYDQFFVKDSKNRKHKVVYAELLVTYKSDVTKTPIRSYNYQDSTQRTMIASVAAADINVGDISGNILFKRAGENMEISFVSAKQQVKKAQKPK